MSTAQQRGTKAWQHRRNLKRVELLVPEDTMASVDAQASEQGMSRSKFILAAVTQALGTARALTRAG